MWQKGRIIFIGLNLHHLIMLRIFTVMPNIHNFINISGKKWKINFILILRKDETLKCC